MTITSTEILDDSIQADGMRDIRFKFTFHTGREIIRRFWADGNYNTAIGITAIEVQN